MQSLFFADRGWGAAHRQEASPPDWHLGRRAGHGWRPAEKNHWCPSLRKSVAILPVQIGDITGHWLR